MNPLRPQPASVERGRRHETASLSNPLVSEVQ